MNAEDLHPGEILLKLIQGHSGGMWASEKVGWTNPTRQNACNWEGIVCDENSVENSVISIDLESQDLYGTLPSELAMLDKLTHINLKDNNFEGGIPAEIAQMPELEVFNMAYNDLDDFMPEFTSQRLRELDLSHNRLKGTIRDDMGFFIPALMKLDLSHNGFVGHIPKTFATLKNLGFLDLSYNLFSGTIPAHIGDLVHLQGLFLNNNHLVGTIPSSLTKSELKLVQIFMEHNHLSGTVPASLSDLAHLKDLYIDENKLTGSIPEDLCRENLNEDFYRANIKEGDQTPRDGCTSIACPVDTVSKEGVYPCFPCGEQGFTPYVGHVGRCYHKNQRVILEHLYDTTDGPEWEGGSGWTFANVEVCAWEGVSCNQAGQVTNITLVNMGLRGQIPPDLGFLRHLQTLNLADNELTGFLPSDLRFAPLVNLDVSGNKIKGIVPPMLCEEGDINGNGADGQFSCDSIACPAGTYSSTGRAGASGGQCSSCQGSYLGSKTCSEGALSYSASKLTNVKQSFTGSDRVLFGSVGAIIAIGFVAFFAIVFKIRRNRPATPYDDGDEFGDYPRPGYGDEFYNYGDDGGFSLDGRSLGGSISIKRESGVLKEAELVEGPDSVSRGSASISLTGGDAPLKERQQQEPLLDDVQEDEGKDDLNDSGELWLDVPKIA